MGKGLGPDKFLVQARFDFLPVRNCLPCKGFFLFKLGFRTLEGKFEFGYSGVKPVNLKFQPLFSGDLSYNGAKTFFPVCGNFSCGGNAFPCLRS